MPSVKRSSDDLESICKKQAVSHNNCIDVAKIYTSIMNFIRRLSRIDCKENPYACLNISKPTTILTELLKKPEVFDLSNNEYKALELCDILMNTDPKILIDRFYEWLNSDNSMKLESIADLESKHSGDLWAKVIIALSYGETIEASMLARSRGDHYFAALIVGPEECNSQKSARDRIRELQEDGSFEKMTICHQKAWYILAGKLSYCSQKRIVVVENLDWERVLGLYIWSGVRPLQSLDHAVQLYNEAMSHLPGTHYLIGNKNTASPPPSCLWAGVLRLWASKMPMFVATKERERRRSADKDTLLMKGWPTDLAWILTLVVPNWFSEDEIYQCTERWCNTLQESSLADQAVLAALFLKSPNYREKLAKSILNKCEWKDEEYLVNKLNIPMLWIQEAKAIHAHSIKDYATEADWYFKANEFKKAKYAILNNLVPTTLLSKNDDLGIRYLLKLDQSGQDGDGLIILSTYQSLKQLSQKVTFAIGNPVATNLVQHEIQTRLNDLKELKDRYTHSPDLLVFIKRLCGKLVRLSTRFDNEFFERLSNNTLSTQHTSTLSVEEFSQSFFTSFATQVQRQQDLIL